MAQKPKERYIVQGHEFVLKETSKKNREALAAFMKEYQSMLLDTAEAVKNKMERENLLREKEAGAYDGEIPDEVEIEWDEYEFYFKLFCALTTGPHHLINMDEFDIKVAEQVKEDFLPESHKTANALLAFSNSLPSAVLTRNTGIRS